MCVLEITLRPCFGAAFGFAEAFDNDFALVDFGFAEEDGHQRAESEFEFAASEEGAVGAEFGFIGGAAFFIDGAGFFEAEVGGVAGADAVGAGEKFCAEAAIGFVGGFVADLETEGLGGYVEVFVLRVGGCWGGNGKK